MNTRLSCRRAALIERAAEQRRQLVYAFSRLAHSLRPMDQGIGWMVKHRHIALWAAAFLWIGVVSRKKKLMRLLAFALTLFRVRRLAREIIGSLHRGNP